MVRQTLNVLIDNRREERNISFAYEMAGDVQTHAVEMSPERRIVKKNVMVYESCCTH